MRKHHVAAARAATIEIEADGTVIAVNDVELSDGRIRSLIADEEAPTAPHNVNEVLRRVATTDEDPATMHGLAPRDVNHLRHLLHYVTACSEQSRPAVICRALMNVLRHFGENAYMNEGARKYLALQAHRYERAASGR